MTHFYRVHCVKKVQIRSFFWSVFGHFSRNDGVIHSMHEELGKHKSLRNKIVVKEDDESRPFPNLSLLQIFLLRFNS